MLISALGGVILEVVSEGEYFCPLASKDIMITAMQRIRRIETSEIVHSQRADEEQYQPDNASSLPESCLREKTALAVFLAPPDGTLEWKSAPCLLGGSRRRASQSMFLTVGGCKAIGDCCLVRFHVIVKEKFSWARPFRGRACCLLLSSSMAEHPAVNRRVVGSSPT